MSIHTLNGLSQASQNVEDCLKDTPYNINNGSIIIPVNGTCIEAALSYDDTELQVKQQVSTSTLCSNDGSGVLQILALGDLWPVCSALRRRKWSSIRGR